MKKIKENKRLYSNEIVDQLFDEISPEEYKRTERRMQLAARIEDGMKAKGMKKKDLAKALKKQPSIISKWLSGTHNFTSDTLWDIGDIVGIDLINLSNKKVEQVTNYFISVSQDPTSKSSSSNISIGQNELVQQLSSNVN